MTLTLEIQPEMARRLKRTARQRGLATDQCAISLLEEGLSGRQGSSKTPLEDDPLMEMAGVDDFEPVSIDEVIYR